MIRTVLGWMLILHALAHVSSSRWNGAPEPVWVSATLCALAVCGYMAAGLGVLRMPVLRRWWKPLVVLATSASLVLIVWTRPAWAMAGAGLDVGLLLVTVVVYERRIDAYIAVIDALGSDALAHPAWCRLGHAIGAVGLVYVGVVVQLHPIIMQWGSTRVERSRPLPGDDEQASEALYRIDHAITIHAPARAIWPWLVQLAVGDTALAVQHDYLGGRLGTVDWRVNTFVTDTVLGLEHWGTFVLVPIDSGTTRLIVRMRRAERIGLAAFLSAPFGTLVVEPAHFIMEQRMLRGIRDRAERTGGATLSASTSWGGQRALPRIPSGIPLQKNK